MQKRNVVRDNNKSITGDRGSWHLDSRRFLHKNQFKGFRVRTKILAKELAMSGNMTWFLAVGAEF